MMETDKNTLNALVEYLVEHGYPKESIAIEYPAGRRKADLAVVDPKTKDLVAVFELKRERNKQSEKLGREQLKSYLAEIGSPSIPTYLVFQQPGTPPFEIERIRHEEKVSEGGSDVPPSFQILQQSRRSTVVADKGKEKKHAVDVFLSASRVFACLPLAILAADWIFGFKMTDRQLILLGVSVSLFLIPYVSKLKLLGIEFERLQKGSEE